MITRPNLIATILALTAIPAAWEFLPAPLQD